MVLILDLMEAKSSTQNGVLFIVIIVAVWYFWPSEEWSGYFYPDKNNLINYEFTGTFKSLEECRDVTLAHGENLGIPISRFDYECGLNCKSESGLNICKETLR